MFPYKIISKVTPFMNNLVCIMFIRVYARISDMINEVILIYQHAIFILVIT